LAALLRELRLEPSELLTNGADPGFALRLAAYWSARNRFLEAGRDVRPAPRVEAMLAQVREPLLSVLRISPDFRPAYDPLLAMARALVGSDASAARALLAELNRVQPARNEAPRLLAMIDAATSNAAPIRH
jgi:spermidine synthase